MLRSLISCGALIAASLPGHPSRSAGQQPDDRAIAGTVADTEGTPLSQAEVAVIEHDSAVLLVHTNDLGRFRVDVGNRASVTLRVRRVGFEPRMIPVRIADGDKVATVFVKLQSTDDKLAAMHVADADEDVDANALAGGFYQRRANARFGFFLDQADIANVHAQQMSDVLRRVPGILIKPSQRGGNLIRVRNCGNSIDATVQTAPLVWLDGIRAPAAELDDLIRPAQVAGIEIYTSQIGVPGEFVDRTACGTILVWSRNR